MGTWLPQAKVQQLLDALPVNTLLCLDEAYIEFADPDVAPAIDVTNSNVIRMRTFSKAFGMAGARIGYAIANEELAAAFNKIRNHFGVNILAQHGALAALGDEHHLLQTQQNVVRARMKIAEIATANGLDSLPSATNFVTIDCGHDGEFANAVLANLVEKGIFVRKPFVAPQDRCIRISAGTDDDLATFEAAFPAALAAARQSKNS
jgi:histidinol-phosphate aminotransferase